MIERCPVCNGSGFVSKRLYERPGETCSWGSYMNETGYVQCHSCGGKGIVGQDNWFKVTPETMPPDMEPVIVTVRGNEGGKLTWVDVRYNPEYQEWEQLSDSVGDYWEGLGKDYEVTHWMPYPEPAG